MQNLQQDAGTLDVSLFHSFIKGVADMGNPSATKADRLVEMEFLLMDHPQGMTQAEIARRLGVDRSTISRYMGDIQAPVYEEGGKFFLDRGAYLLNLRFTLHEALGMHLAARLLAEAMDRQNAHAAGALRKIGQALARLAPQISLYVTASAEKIDDLARYENPTYMRVLEALTNGWAEGHKVRVWHRKSNADPVMEYVVSPYDIEPAAVGRSTYVIGLREPPGELRTLKIERIEHAELLREPYTIPAGFDPQALLRDAWGIWYTGEEPVEVVLRFSPAVASRVLETRWHPSQQVERQPDGGLLWRAWIAEPQEMMPWIRGWGAEVEVLEPPGVRDSLTREVSRLLQIYYPHLSGIDVYGQKTDSGEE